MLNWKLNRFGGFTADSAAASNKHGPAYFWCLRHYRRETADYCLEVTEPLTPALLYFKTMEEAQAAAQAIEDRAALAKVPK